jgi:hypothetical protein
VALFERVLEEKENVRYTDEDRDKILNYLDGMDEKTGYEYGIEVMFCLCIRIGELRAHLL